MLAEHQIAAVRRALAAIEAHGGVLLADAPGLGKSFVAAEVARRFGGESEFVVPAGLVSQWRETLDDFGLEALVTTHDALARSPFVARPAARRLVVVDEAHAFRNPGTLRYDALARRTLGAAVMLVTATPLCNAVGDLHALLQIIAPDDALSAAGVPSIDVAFETGDREAIAIVLAELMIRRERDVLPDGLQFGALRRRVIRHAVPDVPIDALTFPLVEGAPLLRRFLRRRLESSEAALIESIRRQRRFYERVIESGRPLNKRDYRRAFSHEEDADAFQQVLFWDLWSAPQGLDVAAIRDEMARLDELQRAVDRAPRLKRALLRDLLASQSEPALIFTISAATARDLAAFLGCGVATSRDGRSAIEAFRRGTIDILVATDLAGEGLNLQRAGLVVHYDIPWNPVKLEQRNGRAHRIGQLRDAVDAVYFLSEEDRSEVFATVASKNRARRRIFAGEAEATWGGDIPQPTMRPRITRNTAAFRFLESMRCHPFEVPESLERRHRAGLERLLVEMSREYVDRRRIDDLLEIAAAER